MTATEKKWIAISGASGFVGQALCRALLQKGYGVYALGRDKTKLEKCCPAEVHPDLQPHDYSELASLRPHAVVNLAGENIAQRRWSLAQKQRLLDSRVQTTRQLVSAARRDWPTLSCFISASAIGVYGDRGESLLDENSAAGNGFSAELCRHWEACVDNLPCRTVIARLGVVLDRDRKQGALAKMRPAFALGLGTRFGSGQQWQAYIHRRDVVEALCFFIDHEECRGVYNLVSPEPVRNQEFSQQLARALHRPLFLQMPQAVAALLFGEMQELFFSSQRVVPAALASSGYPFQFSSMEAILRDCVERP